MAETDINAITVSDLNKLVRQALKYGFPDSLWVEGEISRVNVHSSGHMYFVLKDEFASVSAVMFKFNRQKLKFDVEHGMQVLCLSKVDLYEKDGKYQIYVEEIVPKGIGALELAFRQLKEKLEKEGLFAEERKKRLPFLPKTIGVVTSPTGAAIRDIINVLSRRFPGVSILLYPVRVQGVGAAEEIAQAINDLNAFFKEELDLLIVGRGGGSIEDLWAFNEEVVARAIAESSLPVISAVGHEIDFTIADFVADKRAPTPSAGAEMAVPDKSELLSFLSQLRLRLRRSISHKWDNLLWRFSEIRNSRAFVEPQYKINEYLQTLDLLMERLRSTIEGRLEKTKLQISALAGKLEVLSPLKTLSRGYSIVYKRGTNKVISRIGNVKKNDVLLIRVSDGTFEAGVLSLGKKKVANAGKAEQQTLF